MNGPLPIGALLYVSVFSYATDGSGKNAVYANCTGNSGSAVVSSTVNVLSSTTVSPERVLPDSLGGSTGSLGAAVVVVAPSVGAAVVVVAAAVVVVVSPLELPHAAATRANTASRRTKRHRIDRDCIRL